MYDDLFEKDPKMQRIRAESEAKGRAEGEAEGEARGEAKGEIKGETRGLQTALITVVENRFPPLTKLAHEKVKRINKPDALTMLLKGITVAPDEATARLLLELLVA